MANTVIYPSSYKLRTQVYQLHNNLSYKFYINLTIKETSSLPIFLPCHPPMLLTAWPPSSWLRCLVACATKFPFCPFNIDFCPFSVTVLLNSPRRVSSCVNQNRDYTSKNTSQSLVFWMGKVSYQVLIFINQIIVFYNVEGCMQIPQSSFFGSHNFKAGFWCSFNTQLTV